MKVTKVMLADLYDSLKKVVKRGPKDMRYVTLLVDNKLVLAKYTKGENYPKLVLDVEKTDNLLHEVRQAIDMRCVVSYKGYFQNSIEEYLLSEDEKISSELGSLYENIISYVDQLVVAITSFEGALVTYKPLGKLSEEELNLAQWYLLSNPNVGYVDGKTGTFSIDPDNYYYKKSLNKELLSAVIEVSSKGFKPKYKKGVIEELFRRKPTNEKILDKYVKTLAKVNGQTEEEVANDLLNCLSSIFRECQNITYRLSNLRGLVHRFSIGMK